MSANKILLQMQREYWEYRFSFICGSVLGGVLPILIAIFIFYYGPQKILDGQINLNMSDLQIKEFVNPANEKTLAFYHFHKEGAFAFFAQAALAISVVAYLFVYAILALNYAFGSLFSDRKSREILFWRSLPLGETDNMLGKLLTLCISLPLLSLVGSLVVWLLIVLSGAAYAGDLGLFWYWLCAPKSGLLMWFWLLIFLPLCFLPIASWALFMSSLVKNHPGVIGILMPVLWLAAESWVRFHWAPEFGLHPALNAYVDTMGNYIGFLDDKSVMEWFSVESGFWKILFQSLSVTLLFVAMGLWLRNNRYEI